jgi:NADH:ubiquinone oxidoreductase subunit H
MEKFDDSQYIVILIPMFFFKSITAEINRSPIDLFAVESESVSGFNVDLIF